MSEEVSGNSHSKGGNLHEVFVIYFREDENQTNDLTTSKCKMVL